jgi:four helix bundle protein
MSECIIYTKSLRIISESSRLSSTWPLGSGYLRDQLQRASSSVLLNFSEGRGRASRKERERFFTIARGSVCETKACLDVAHALGLIDDGIRSSLTSDCMHVSRALLKFGAR